MGPLAKKRYPLAANAATPRPRWPVPSGALFFAGKRRSGALGPGVRVMLGLALMVVGGQQTPKGERI